MVCLDSDVIIDFLRGDKEAVKKILEIQNRSELVTTSINTFEILRGLSKLNKLEQGYNFITNLKILGFDFEASEKAAEIFEDLRLKGKTLDPLDIMIASISIINDEILVTRNIKHFEKISELNIETLEKI